jgi:hypothetical protein
VDVVPGPGGAPPPGGGGRAHGPTVGPLTLDSTPVDGTLRPLFPGAPRSTVPASIESLVASYTSRRLSSGTPTTGARDLLFAGYNDNLADDTLSDLLVLA